MLHLVDQPRAPLPDEAHHTVAAVDHTTGQTHVLPYDKLIIATGATPIIPPIDHVKAPNVFLLRSMEDTKAVRTFLNDRHPKNAVIIGAGFIGLEMAEALRDRGIGVTVVEKASHVLPPLDAEYGELSSLEEIAVMDGTFVGDGPGPRAMRWQTKNVILASADQVAIDAISAKMMGLDPMSIKFIRMAHEDGLGTGDPNEIEVVGEDISEVNWRLKASEETFASRGQKLIYWGPLKRLETLLLRTVIDNSPGLEAICDALHFPLTTATTPATGTLPLTRVGLAVRTTLPSDDVILESAALTGMDAFEEVVKLEDVARLPTPFKTQLVEIVRAHAPEAVSG